MQKQPVKSRNHDLFLSYPQRRHLSGAATPDESGPRSDGNEEVLRIPQRSSTTGTSSMTVGVFYSPSQLDKHGLVWFLCLMSYQASRTI